MKNFFPVVLLCLALSSCGESGTTPPPAATETKAAETWEYVCVHKCEGGFSHERGKCTACGMPLVASASLNTEKPAAPGHTH